MNVRHTCERCKRTRFSENPGGWADRIEICAECRETIEAVKAAFKAALNAKPFKLQRRSLHEWLTTFVKDGQSLKVMTLNNGDIALVHENGVHCTFVKKDET